MGYLAESLQSVRTCAPTRVPPPWSEAAPLDWLLAMPADFAVQRAHMVAALRLRLAPFAEVLGAGAIARALDAVGAVARERFVCPLIDDLAYLPSPLDIGADQIISHPFLAALLAAAADPQGGTVLDVGCGSGYQAAVLAHMAQSVVAVEIVPGLARIAARRLADSGCANGVVHAADAAALPLGHSRFDAIVVAAGAPRVPRSLLAALKPGGRLVMPIGRDRQMLTRIVRRPDGSHAARALMPTRFVPLTGVAGC